ncbi:MAG: FAD binding domain-containing protein [Deltaproteobacteria bacterium]|nr:FAD binding domain-containing protein [Deltaproteobacteria bacterium]
MWEEYLSPSSTQEAVDMLRSYNGEAQIIAGGTDLVLDLSKGTRKAKCLIDIGDIDELKKIDQDGDEIVIGAGVVFSRIISSKLIQEKAYVLAEAAATIGSPQIRNTGTVVGNVVSAQPAADAAVALFALDARAEIVGSDGKRIVPLGELYEGVGISKVDSTAEIVTGVRFKALGSNQGSAFMRLAQRKALALPVLNAAATVAIKGDKFYESLVVIAPVATRPFRSEDAENCLKGASIDKGTIEEAAEAAAGEANPRDSALRGSAEYRKKMAKVLVKRAIQKAVERAKE